MGQACTCDDPSPFQQLYNQQEHLSKQLFAIGSAEEREKYSKQLSELKLSEAITMYNQFYLGQSSTNNSLHFTQQAEKFNEEPNSSCKHNCSSQSSNEYEKKYYPLLNQKMILKQGQYSEDDESLWRKMGEEAIRKNQLGVILLHGKQQNNIGYGGPIGTYDIGLDSACSIFSYLISKLRRLSEICHGEYFESDMNPKDNIKIYILTNSHSKKQIIKYFKANDFFGYGQSNIFFFSQDVYPVMDTAGKVMLQSNSQIMVQPLGNGMLFYELYNKNILHHLQSNQIKYLYIGNSQNVLMKIGDPLKLGYLISKQKQIVMSCLRKQFVGVSSQKFGYVGTNELGNVKVYENLISAPEECDYINSGQCLISLDHLQKLAKSPKFYSSCSTYKYINKRFRSCYNTQNKTYEKRLCLSFQSYYHDILEFCSAIGFIQISSEEFCPVKSLTGVFTPKTAREKIWKNHKKWVEEQGFTIQNCGRIEFAPWITYNGQGVKEQLQKRMDISRIKMPIFIS